MENSSISLPTLKMLRLIYIRRRVHTTFYTYIHFIKDTRHCKKDTRHCKLRKGCGLGSVCPVLMLERSPKVPPSASISAPVGSTSFIAPYNSIHTLPLSATEKFHIILFSFVSMAMLVRVTSKALSLLSHCAMQINV